MINVNIGNTGHQQCESSSKEKLETNQLNFEKNIWGEEGGEGYIHIYIKYNDWLENLWKE